MKASEFKKLIKETVKEAVKEVLQENLTPPVSTSPNTLGEATSNQPEVNTAPLNSLSSMIAETKNRMTSEDFRNVINMDSSMAPNFKMQSTIDMENSTPNLSSAPKVGVDIAGLDFVKNASKVVKASIEKDKMKYGV
jgi:hypothetical protein